MLVVVKLVQLLLLRRLLLLLPLGMLLPVEASFPLHKHAQAFPSHTLTLPVALLQHVLQVLVVAHRDEQVLVGQLQQGGERKGRRQKGEGGGQRSRE